MKSRAWLLMALLSLAGCASTPPVMSNAGLVVLQQDNLPAPDVAALAAQSRAYYIGPFDKLSITVYGIEELSSKAQVDGSGRLSVPLAGSIQAGGQTVSQLESEIAARLRARHVRDPQVTVNLEEVVSQTVAVDGEVREPGIYPVVGRMTLIQAIARAKGTTEYSRLEEVVLFRTVSGQRMAGVYNLAAIRRGAYADPEVYPADVVVVGDSPQRRVFRDLIASAPLLTTPLLILFR